MTSPCNLTPETIGARAEGKLASLFSKLKTILGKIEAKLLSLLKRALELLKKYWKFLILPTRLLILYREKIKEENFWNCERN